MLQDPGGREPAPEPLRLVQAFVNTLDIENGVEELASPAALHEILVRIDALPADEARLGDEDLQLALEAREALRSLAFANNGGALAPEAPAVLARVADAAQFTLRFDGGARPRLAPTADGLAGALGRILAVVYDAIVDGTWQRLKACPRDVCYWVFYDRSRNGSGKWCAMSVCGNRTNTQAYRRRAHAT